MWGECERSGVHLQKLGPILNGDWCLSMVFPLEEQAHPENVIPCLKDRVPPPAAALNRPFQVETPVKLPEGSVAGNAPTAAGTCGDGIRHCRRLVLMVVCILLFLGLESFSKPVQSGTERVKNAGV